MPNSPDLEYYTGSEVVTLKVIEVTPEQYRYAWLRESGEQVETTRYLYPESALMFADKQGWLPNDIATGLL